MATFELTEDDELIDFIMPRFTVPELRTLASNVGVSRERGDNKRQTVKRLVEQEPRVAAKVVEADPEVDVDVEGFKLNREVGFETISLEEAQKRAKNKKLMYRLKHLKLAVDSVPTYKAEVNWNYAPDLNSIVIKKREDADYNPLLDGRAHIIVTSKGRAWTLEVDDIDFAKKDMSEKSKWRRTYDNIERFWE